MAEVILEKVKKVYDGGFVAVKGADLKIADKEFMVIVGPSGCGKTTTLRMIAGLENISDGVIRIGGDIINDTPPKDRDIAMVFQNYALYPHMTVYQNMAFGLKLRKYSKSEIKNRVAIAAKLLGIEPLMSRKPKALSGGQRQRVAVGRAIVRNPKAFLFDEPLSNLDAKLRVTTRAELKALHRRLEATSIYVTHDQAEAMTLGDRICVMYNGEIQQVASPMEVYDKPANAFVAGFLGTPPMNFFDGRIAGNSGTLQFVLPDGLAVSLDDKIFGPYQGRDMVFGVRPEDMSVAERNSGAENIISAVADVVEPLGDRTDVYLTSKSGHKFIANIDPRCQVRAGDVVEMSVDVEKAHVFEPGDTGRNVSLAD